jgi:hypothetical protein
MKNVRPSQQPSMPPAVNFFSIEIATPAQTFWQSLARLLFTLGAAAGRKGEARR